MKVYKNVVIGKNCLIAENVILGLPPNGRKDGELKTIIGDNSVIRENVIIYAGNIIGDNFHAGHNVTIREENEIGNDVSIGTGTCIEHHIKIQNDVRIHSQVFVPEYSELMEGCWLGPNVVLTNAKYPQSIGVKESLKGPIIKKNAKIGANSTILPSVIIGESSLIGAGSVVSKDVEDSSVVVGSPARRINSLNNITSYNN